MGTRAAMKNAIMLFMEVRATLVPVRRKQSPVRSFMQNAKTRISQERKREETERKEGSVEEIFKSTLKGILLPASVKE